MERDAGNARAPLRRHALKAAWTLGIPLLLLILVGCLTTYASGPPARTSSDSSLAGLPLPNHTPTVPPTSTPGITLVPNMAVRAFQTTPTTTVTTTPTLTPETVTATAQPADTTQPTDTAEPTATPEPTDTPAPTNTPRPTTIPATVAPFQAYAWVDNYFPVPGSVVTVHGRLFKNGRPVNGAQMGVTWSYTHREDYCSAYTGIDGRAACSRNIGYPLQNYWVFVDVVFVHEDQLFYAKTAFLTDP
jgi:hypothetical protein